MQIYCVGAEAVLYFGLFESLHLRENPQKSVFLRLILIKRISTSITMTITG